MPDESRFHHARARDLRRSTRWHRLSYIIRVLPARLEVLSRSLALGPEASVLDYGCAEAPYRHFFAPETRYLAADLPGNPDANVEIRPDGTVPIETGTMDAVLSTQVLEHAADPRVYLAECFRVLRPGGRLLLSTHGLMVYHPDPVDYWRWTCAGLQREVTTAGFEIRHFEGIMGLAATGLQLVQDSYYYRLPRRLAPGLALLLQTLITVAERFEGQRSRDLNALVFAVVAEKP